MRDKGLWRVSERLPTRPSKDSYETFQRLAKSCTTEFSTEFSPSLARPSLLPFRKRDRVFGKTLSQCSFWEDFVTVSRDRKDTRSSL